MPVITPSIEGGSKTVLEGLETITPMGAPTYSVSSINAAYTLLASIGLTVSDTSLLNSVVAGQGSGVILSGAVVNTTAKTKDYFSIELTVLAVVGNMLLASFNLPFTDIGLTNPTSGDTLVMSFNYSLPGAYTSSILKVTTTIS